MELYFHDHSFVPLFIQENYLKTQPVKARNLEGPPKMLKQLELMSIKPRLLYLTLILSML
ncbi:hypothetical protein DEU56DRAFT_820594 [Suillus clintonianus]|uniref:uncharacterized protein n=1 Tax=Suillus clintonianus TaxID=1904413 RepID=UPI001B887107|nr:uncharacterized protein DEU56DRAFT_820594 [Suillus clintonianus]KAG2127202.1 hypothetical protein DEU56DRAFT_820594 [Suillus clintonianus]